MRAVLRAALVVLLTAVVPARPAAAGPTETTVIPVREGDDQGPKVRVSTTQGAAGVPAGGWGWLRVDARNEDSRPHVFGVRLETFFGQTVMISRSARIGPGESARLLLPQPHMSWGRRIAFLVDGTLREHSSGGWSGGEATLLMVTSDNAWSSRTSGLFRSQVKSGTRLEPEIVEPADLPDRWTFLSGVPLMIVDGSARRLGAEPQRVILDFVRAGGNALVLKREALPTGPLSDALAEKEGYALGLGRAWAFDDGELDDAAPKAALARWDGELAAGAASHQPMPGILPPGFLGRLQIPGLGRVPVRLFFFVILAFAVLVGPVTWVVLRRRRRLGYLVAIVPAAGLLFTVGILAYGVLSEGLGTKGVARSFTLLDQVRHEGVSTAGRTLYAGLSPRALTPSVDTFFHSTDLAAEDYDSARYAPPFQWDLDIGRIGGGALASRTPTGFGTVTQGRMRERLRFRKAGDGRWEALPDASFPPLREAGSIVFCAPDGTWHVGDGTGPLTPVAPRAASDVVEKKVEWLSAMEIAEEPEESGSRHILVVGRPRLAPGSSVADDPRTRAWITSRLRDALHPGSYLVASGTSPFLDDLGLDVHWLAGRHLVVGRLAPEDVDE